MKKTILVVDDDANIQELLQAYLGQSGFDVLQSPDGKDALRQCIVKKPDLILMDFLMPELDGMNTLDLITLAKLGRPVPILMMSGTVSREIMENSKRLGATDFLVKPFNPSELISKIERILSGEIPTPAVKREAAKKPSAPQGVPLPHRAPPAKAAPPKTAPPETITARQPSAKPAPPAEESVPAAKPIFREAAPPPPPAVKPPPPVEAAPETAEVAPPRGARAIDDEVLSNLMATLEETGFIVRAIDGFISRSMKELLEAQLAIREKSVTDVVRIAYALKAESAFLGASQFSALCDELEQTANAGALGPDSFAVVKNLREEYKRCKVELEAFKENLLSS